MRRDALGGIVAVLVPHVSPLDRPAYDELTLIEITVQRGGLPFAPEPQRVVVTVGHPPGGSYPALADDLAAKIETGHDLVVEVRLVGIQVRTGTSTTQ